MISRRLLISSAAAVGAAGFSGSLFAAAPDPVLGKDYIEVRPPLDFPKNRSSFTTSSPTPARTV